MPAAKKFTDLTSEQMAKAGLLPEVAQQFRFVITIYEHAQQSKNVNYSRRFAPLSHFMILRLKEGARTESEWEMLEKDTFGTNGGSTTTLRRI